MILVVNQLIHLFAITGHFFIRCFLLGALILSCACDFIPSSASPTLQLSGSTMGTYYRVVVVDDADHFTSPEAYAAFEQETLQQRIDLQLSQLLLSMSTYQSNSEISLFNKLIPPACQTISSDFTDVMAMALDIAEDSDGYFNPLLNPLIHRWGFSSKNMSVNLPTQIEIDELLTLTQFSGFSVDFTDRKLCKSKAVELDLSGIAKGYGVDQIVHLLTQIGSRHFLVDIGGEVRVLGENARGQPWRLAIEKPDGSSSIQEVVALSHHAIATSGDYRNFFIHQGRRYSHLINPKSGYPISHDMASVSVIAETTAQADAWATALLASGEVNAKRFAESKGLAVMMVFRENEPLEYSGQTRAVDYTEFRTWTSQAFKPFIDLE
tara:strand:- start:531 stop:1670 length:1140 start_codon:yes stop_codon:yes gene_type:complete